MTAVRASTPPLDLEEIRRRLRAALPTLRAAFHVARLEIFGSYVRGEARPDSDVDVLVTFLKTPNLFEVVELQNTLQEILGVPVDLTLKKVLKPRLKGIILQEAVEV